MDLVGDVLRVVVFCLAAVVIGLCAPWLAAMLRGLPVRPTRGARVGAGLLATGLASLAASVIVTNVGQYGNPVDAGLLLALVGSSTAATGLLLLRNAGRGNRA